MLASDVDRNESPLSKVKVKFARGETRVGPFGPAQHNVLADRNTAYIRPTILDLATHGKSCRGRHLEHRVASGLTRDR